MVLEVYIMTIWLCWIIRNWDLGMFKTNILINTYERKKTYELKLCIS